MRIRSIRPEFWTSEDIVALSWEQRLIYIGLWSYVDDNGVGRDVPRLIAADLFALDEDTHGVLMQVAGALKQLETRKMVTRYTVCGKAFLHITAWEKHQKINRPSGERYPLPTRGETPLDATFSEPSLSPQVKNPLGEGEKGRRGEGKRVREVSRFDEFWSVYPRKVGKIAARKNWDRLLTKGIDQQEVINGAKAYAQTQLGADPTKVKHPQGWLSDGRWEDELETTPARVNDGRPEGW